MIHTVYTRSIAALLSVAVVVCVRTFCYSPLLVKSHGFDSSSIAVSISVDQAKKHRLLIRRLSTNHNMFRCDSTDFYFNEIWLEKLPKQFEKRNPRRAVVCFTLRDNASLDLAQCNAICNVPLKERRVSEAVSYYAIVDTTIHDVVRFEMKYINAAIKLHKEGYRPGR